MAAAVDYEAMTEFLLEKNANIDARTYGELQAPIHYAAKNGATRSLKMLLSFDAKIDTLDAKQRTPLQVSFVVSTKNLYKEPQVTKMLWQRCPSEGKGNSLSLQPARCENKLSLEVLVYCNTRLIDDIRVII